MRLIHAARSADGSVPESELRKMAQLASEECLAKGVTSFHDAGSNFGEVEFLERLEDEGALGVRLWMMIRDSNENLAEKLAATRTLADGDDYFAVGGIKVSIDGALGSRGAWLLEDYSDSPGATGLNLVNSAKPTKAYWNASSCQWIICSRLKNCACFSSSSATRVGLRLIQKAVRRPSLS